MRNELKDERCIVSKPWIYIGSILSLRSSWNERPKWKEGRPGALLPVDFPFSLALAAWIVKYTKGKQVMRT